MFKKLFENMSGIQVFSILIVSKGEFNAIYHLEYIVYNIFVQLLSNLLFTAKCLEYPMSMPDFFFCLILLSVAQGPNKAAPSHSIEGCGLSVIFRPRSFWHRLIRVVPTPSMLFLVGRDFCFLEGSSQATFLFWVIC